MMKALKIAALCAVGAMAAEQAEVTYYNSTQCNSGQISTVNVNPNSCQVRLTCSGGDWPSTCTGKESTFDITHTHTLAVKI